ncbi:unnamed protein product (macronuclear) [Paramecium tetraurelia]|uniref:SH2 domain-containing protein n=1 Tax=Paramecium tetraurelia TaxID=5888 RepID=A0DHH5_PARTE|nr:uncharacterized protein GSPATT00016879001 [Paramecium tetraurelia]CAK82492.1 unnamed protein product [Paramecium tetraurelia]|eukprot:XP_001449889.1 hypothetical protein (macronuclear) [Paramecium tetraurelia strain d4-2]
MSQKKNDCELILIDPQDDSDIKPMKILKKLVSNAGGVRYLVEYSNNEQKQETEKYMKENYQELIEDYNYFSVCGSRFDQLTLQKMRENNNKMQNFENHAKLPTIPSDENYPIFKRQKKIDKQIEKNIKVNNNQILPLPQQTQQQLQQQQQIPQQQQIQQHNSLLQNEKYLIKQQQVQNQTLLSLKSDQGDKIKSITLENGLFLIQWQPRPDGNVPYQEYYHYDFLKATAPTILLSFLEQEFLNEDQKFKNLKRQSYQNSTKENDDNPQYKDKSINITQTDKSQEIIEVQKEVLKDDHPIKRAFQFEEVKEQKDNSKDILIDDFSVDDAQEVILDEKQTAEQEKKQQQQKKGIIPSFKPQGSTQKSRKQMIDKAQELFTVEKAQGKLDEKLSQMEKPTPKQQVTITQPKLSNQSFPAQFAQAQAPDEFEILGSLEKPEDKQNQNYEKELEECYSDVELPHFQFNQSEI